MKPLPTALALVLAAITAPGLAADDAVAGCARIADVAVPYDVDVGADALRFESGSGSILIAADRIEAGERTFRDATVRRYHDDLRGFLANAGSMASVARSFMRRGAFPQAATDMCRAILAVHASGEAVERRFPGFDNPVRITLK